MTTPSAAPAVTFWGAAQTVTGSMHLVESAGQKLLLDCGMPRGPRPGHRAHPVHFPFDAVDIAAVVLSHAHIDHCGNLPRLVHQGFTGPIYCTPATRDLCEIMLADSGHIQEKDAEYLNKKLAQQNLPPIQPLYGPGDAVAALKLF